MWHRVPGSDQGGASGIYQVNIVSGLVPVLSLGLLTKVSEYTKASHCPPWPHRPLRVV